MNSFIRGVEWSGVLGKPHCDSGFSSFFKYSLYIYPEDHEFLLFAVRLISLDAKQTIKKTVKDTSIFQTELKSHLPSKHINTSKETRLYVHTSGTEPKVCITLRSGRLLSLFKKSKKTRTENPLLHAKHADAQNYR